MKSALIALLAICLCLPLIGDRDANKKFEATKTKAAKGDAEAQSELGLMYEYGRGVKLNLKEAVKWHRKAADQKDKESQFHLGMMYDFGRGVRQDSKEAVKWYHKSAEQGYVDAQYNLGVRYATGTGVQRDVLKAYVWWNLSMLNGNTVAGNNKLLIAEKMTPDQIAKGQELSKEMVKKNPKLINE